MASQIFDRRTVGIPGTVTPDVLAAKAAAEVARDQAEVFSATTLKLQDGAVAILVRLTAGRTADALAVSIAEATEHKLDKHEAASTYATHSSVRAQVPPLVSLAIAADDAPARAAAAAAKTAVEEKLTEAGLLSGAASIPTDNVTFSVTDAEGRRSWIEVADDGGPTAHSMHLLGTRTSLPTVTASDSVMFSVTDAEGRRSWLEAGTDGKPTPHARALMEASGSLPIADGSVTEAKLAPLLASRIPAAFTTTDTIVDGKRSLTVRDPWANVRPLTSNSKSVSFWGDSLFQGHPQPNPFATDGTNSLPGAFASLNPDITVFNGGRSGQSADEIAIRQGGIVLMLTVVGGTIPESGGVEVTTDAILGWRLDRSIAGTTGSLAGVAGSLTRNGHTITFTRSTSGGAVAVVGPMPWESFGRNHSSGLQVILAGRNDIGYASAAGAVVDRVVTATRAMVESLTPAHPRVLLLGTITSTGEGRGSAGYVAVTSINKKLRELYPQFFWDFRSWLVNEAIHAVGTPPTENDEMKMAEDTLPPSIMVAGDSVHYSPATASAAASRIKLELTHRGWI